MADCRGMPHVMHMEIEGSPCGVDEPSCEGRKMDSTILESFSKLVNNKERERIIAGVSVLRYMQRRKLEETESKELSYALMRLVRGLGSSRASNRKGFYATLTAYLKINSDVPVENLLKIANTELHPVNSNNKSENADIYMGRILLCGSIIRSKKLQLCTAEEQQKVFTVLFSAGQKRNYLSFLSASFLIDYITQLDVKQLKTGIWPLLKVQLGKPWAEQNLDTFYLLMIMKEKFPTLVSAKFLKEHLGTESIIDREHTKELLKLLTDIPRIMCCRHPVYKLFCEDLVSTDHLVEFWLEMDERFVKPSKSIEFLGIAMLKHILTNLNDKSLVPSLLTPNFLRHMLKRFTACKRNKQDELATEFRALLSLLVSIMKNEDIKAKTKVSLLKKLIYYPGSLMVEKITGTKVVQMLTANMNADGVKKLSKVYHEIASSAQSKEKKGDTTQTWTNAERNYAAQLLARLLGHPAVSAEQAWRLDQLKFLFNLGLSDMSNVGVELAVPFKESFYRALDHKLPKLNDLRTVLNELIHHLNDEIFVNETSKLRTPLTEPAINAWKQMMAFVVKLEKDSTNKQAVLIFHIMDLMMGLQLFSDPEMAVSAINEIHSCFERLTKKKSKKTKKDNDRIDEEPEWVEVIVDLLISLLSRNSHLLRSLVGCVFPHMCSLLTASSIHQILSVLDPKNDKSPLVAKGEEYADDSSNDEDSESEDEENDENNEDTVSDKEPETESDSDKDTSGDEDNDETVTDRLRLAVRQALGDACVQTDDEDIDVDQIDDDQGKRLDESLAAAFRILRENRQSPSKKQEKSAQAVTHFRVRVTDLLETYIDSGPSMALALDMVVPLFALLEYCIKDPHQKPLENRVRSCLKKLSCVKKFKDTEGVDAQLLTDISKLLMEKGERSTAICQEMGDKLAQCSTFLVRCVQQAGLQTDTLVHMYAENLTAFFKKRDCVLPATLFKNVLQLHWDGNWHLAPLLVDYAFDNSIRSFRRSQALEFLTIFYRNNRLVKNEEYNTVRLKMEKRLFTNSINLLEELCASQQNSESAQGNNTDIGKEVRQRFVCLLMSLLHVVYTQHLPKAWDWKAISKAIVEYRTLMSLSKDAKSAYNKLASQIGAPINVPTRTNEHRKITIINGAQPNHENGISDSENNSSDEESESTGKISKKEGKNKSKVRSKQKDKQKLKKEARELRAKAMSEGLESFNFSSVKLENGNTEEPMETDVVDEDVKIAKSPKKRTNHESIETPNKTKRKKKNVDVKQ